MKSIIRLYFDYFEKMIIGLLFSSLVLISLCGFIYGRSALKPAIIATVVLFITAYVESGRSRILQESPELNKKPFKEVKLFSALLESNLVRITARFSLVSNKPKLQSSITKAVPILIVTLALYALYSSVLISANIANSKRLYRNQASVEASVGVPATLFNRLLVIGILQISAGDTPTVTAIIHSEGFQDLAISNQSAGYETTYTGRGRFRIRIDKFTPPSVWFFVERLPD